ncbi:MAG: stress response translation initiation inhibitor YciH [Acidobacteriota bacterium]
MAKPKKARTVFSTELGRVCPRCGWPEKNCSCAAAPEESVPDRVVARLRIEKAGRKGKTVTVVDSLPMNQDFLKALAKELKKACGAGGTVVENRVEIQGDRLDRLREILRAKGWTVKG